MDLSVTVCEVDGAVSSPVGSKSVGTVAGKASDLPAHRHLLVCHIVQTVYRMHPSLVVKQQGLAVTSPCTNDLEVQLSRGNDLVCIQVDQGKVAFANHQQLAPFGYNLHAERLCQEVQVNDVRLTATCDDQMSCMADGIAPARHRGEGIPETIVLVAEQRPGVQLPLVQLVDRHLTVCADSQQLFSIREKIHPGDAAFVYAPTLFAT